MSKILGIKYGGHDTSAALLIDGKIVAACAQERYSRDKHSRKFPKEAVNDCLKIGKIKIDDIDEIAFVNDVNKFIREIYLRPALENEERLNFLFEDIEKILKIFNFKKIIREQLGYKGKIKNYRHHLCHVASAYYSSGFDDALCLSVDGFGEHETGIIAAGTNGKIDILHDKNVYPHSLGLIYSSITNFLGWKHHCDEGIIMGLAPFGNCENVIPNTNKTYISIFKEIILEKNDFNYEINPKYIDYYTKRDQWVTESFKEIFGKRRDYKDEITQHNKDIAAALQTRLEEIVLKQLEKAKKKFQFKKLCMSGGVALNCSLNGKIEQSNLFEEIFIVPASGDDGCAIGACYLAYKNMNKKFVFKKDLNFYKGSIFNNQEIETSIKNSGFEYQRPKNLSDFVSELLEKGKIVAWFQGGAEFGPRALGNRSIICKPFPESMRDHLNKRVKFREEFRPFAPSVLDKYQKDFFELNQDSPHMLIASKVKKNKKNLIPAVVHIDDTCRVQTVKKNINERFYDLIESFNKLTKIPVLLNTSFNVKGQPIVNTPSEALETFKSTNIDVLAIGDFVLIK
jgi:carbamoyltransferase